MILISQKKSVTSGTLLSIVRPSEGDEVAPVVVMTAASRRSPCRFLNADRGGQVAFRLRRS
jgi:hypothetical protein